MTTGESTKVNHWAQAERAALSALLREVGPDAPTLCEGWTARDLAAHLVIREGRVDAAVGIAVPALAGWTKKVQDKTAQRPYEGLIDKVQSGPPKTSMMRLEKVDGAANTIEFFVHHEDVRRAQEGWQPRTLDPTFETELWDRLQKFAPRLMKSSPVPLVVRTPDGRSLTAGPTQGEAVTITGPVGELTLLAYGRREVQVAYEGDPASIKAVTDASFGI
jgi:uncharacterized protein (TIGR03085 family)